MIAALVASIGFGLLAAISPCPLATNLAAISILTRGRVSTRQIVLSGMAYALGRITPLVAIAAIVSWGVVRSSTLSHVLQKYGDRATGPLLVIIALVLLDLMPFRLPTIGFGMKNPCESKGVVGAFAMGVAFALAMCPTSAALYFGGLIPLAVRHNAPLALPFAFGFATAAPVLAASSILVLSTNGLSRFFENLKRAERLIRIATGYAFLAYGIWLIVATAR